MNPPPATATAPLNFTSSAEWAKSVAEELEGSTAHEAIEWMFDTFGERHYIACSFQKTSSVTAHIATQINPAARFFYLDTDVLFKETYETRDRLSEFLGVEFDRFHNLTLEEQAERTATSSGRAIPTPAAVCARSSRCAAPSLP